MTPETHAPVASPAEPQAVASPPGENEAPRDNSFNIPLHPLRLRDPLCWLAAGWRDFRRAPLIGMFYGLCFMLMGWALLGVFKHAPIYTLALSAGFLLMGPFLCLGLYRVSMKLEMGEPPRLLDSLLALEPAPLADCHLRRRALDSGNDLGPRRADCVCGQL